MKSTTESYHLAEWQDKTRGSYVRAILEPLQIKDGTAFLDLGCGSGYINAYMASRQRLTSNIGLELEQDTLVLARRLNAGAGSIQWVRASAEEIPLATATMDTVVCRGVVPLARVNQVLTEIARVLRPGGRAVLLVHSWVYYLRWISLNPLRWKRSAAGLLHFALGSWFNLTGQQLVVKVGTHRFGQTYQTEFRLCRVLARRGLRIELVRRDPEFLVYVSKLDGGAS